MTTFGKVSTHSRTGQLVEKRLTSGQGAFIHAIKKEIIEDHKNSQSFKGERNDTIEEKLVTLDVLSMLMLGNDSKKHLDLEMHIYYYYLIRYADTLPEGESLYEDKVGVRYDYPGISDKAKQTAIHFNALVDEFVKTFSKDAPARKMLIPDQILVLALAGEKDLVVLKEELGMSHELYQHASEDLAKFTVGFFAHWMNDIGSKALNTPIHGLSQGKNLQQLSFYIMGVVAQIEVGEKAKKMFAEVSKSVGYSEQALQAQKKGIWKNLFG